MVVLIGEEDSKRTHFMTQAAREEAVPLRLVNWDRLQQEWGQLPEGAVVKIDPPSYQTVCLCDMQEQLGEYQHRLGMLSQSGCPFLNSPEAISRTLDKRQSKLSLQEAGVAVTQMFSGQLQTMEQLIELMRQCHCYSVFIKPRYFSGAAGVAAFRIHPVLGKMKLYTSCQLEKGQLVNTKRIFTLENVPEIERILEALSALDCIVEKWHSKASFQGKSYDLRVVYQFGHIAYIVVRQSKGPITNLHLNNQAMAVEALELEEETLCRISLLCRQAVSCFPGLRMAGIDVMLEKDSNRPLIIEMNGQGDLIYQDIYHRNSIYREQLQWMRRLRDGGGWDESSQHE